MNTAKHTPGPWELKACSGGPGEEPGIWVEANGRPLMRGDFCRSEADANLIAAAPELLAALRELTSVAAEMADAAGYADPPALVAARAALAKAGV